MAVAQYTNSLASNDSVGPSPRIADPLLSESSGVVRAVTQWLRSEGLEVGGQPEVQRFTGGMSHLTYRLRYDTHDLVLRRPLQAHGGVQRVRREFLLQAALRPHYPVPDMVRLCVDPSVAGAPFYVMNHVAGIVPRRRSFPGMTLPREDTQRQCLNMLDKLIELHRVDLRSPGFSDISFGLSSAHQLRKLLLHWLSRHARLKLWNSSDLRATGQWLIDHIPEQQHVSLLHNDWRLDNIVFDAAQPTRIRAVLDWEFASVGDPLMDLGTMLAHWVESDDNFLRRRYRWQPSHLPGMLSRDELVERYFKASGRDERGWVFYQVFGLFRYMVALQELHLRHAIEGGEEKAFFKGVWMLVHYFNWKCRGLIRRG